MKVPNHGLIVGGAYDGYRYRFEFFQRAENGTLIAYVTVHEQDWPFPKQLGLWPSQYESLCAIVGEQTQMVDVKQATVDALRKPIAAARGIGTIK